MGLPASAGIAASKFVAKIASDLAKPAGSARSAPEETRAFLAGLPVSRLWGVGPKLEARLHGLGLRKVGDLATRDVGWLTERLGDIGAHLAALARGEDDRAVVPDRGSKSIGAEDTFEDDLSDPALLEPRLHAQALRVARRLRKAGLRTRVVQLKLKLDDFTVQTRRCTLERPTDDGQELYRNALELLRRAPVSRPVRLTGVSAQELDEAARTPSSRLFGEAPRRSDALNRALDAIADRFGGGAIAPADVLCLEEHDPLDELRARAGVIPARPPRLSDGALTHALGGVRTERSGHSEARRGAPATTLTGHESGGAWCARRGSPSGSARSPCSGPRGAPA